MNRGSLIGLASIASIALLAPPLAAQEDPHPPSAPLDGMLPDLGPADPQSGNGMPEIRTDCPGAEDQFGGSDVEKAGFCLMMRSKWVSVRRLAEKALESDEHSFRGHYLMGIAQHLGEGNLPKALFHLQQAQ
jgi:hypothetical protein